MRVVKRRVKWQFCFVLGSIVFLSFWVIFYASRFYIYHTESRKNIGGSSDDRRIVSVVKKNNYDKPSFKNVRGEYYFFGQSAENYVMYSNQLFRIIKFNYDKSVRMVLNDALVNLSLEHDSFIGSNIASYLNKTTEENTGIYYDILDTSYLTKSSTCKDVVDKVETSVCSEQDETLDITIPDIYDYINTGAKDSFIGSKQNIILSTLNNSGEIWNISSTNGLDNSDTDVLLGVKPVLTLKNDVSIIKGTGTKDDPYIIDEVNEVKPFSYVKLGSDTWRVLKEKDGIVKLVKDSIIDTDEMAYSTYLTSYKTNAGVASYLNTTYYNGLSYKNSLIECSWYNGAYTSKGISSYKNAYSTLVKAKVGIPNINDFLLGHIESDYVTMTPTDTENDMVYMIQSGGGAYGKKVTNKFNIVPSICIEKDILKSGNGTKNKPYGME